MAEDSQLKKQQRRFNKILKLVDENKKDIAKNLIEEAAFMKSTLIDLKEIISQEGVVDEMEQGSYSIIREHPALKSYNTTIQRYTNLIKQLSDLVPKEDKSIIEDGFDEFVKFK